MKPALKVPRTAPEEEAVDEEARFHPSSFNADTPVSSLVQWQGWFYEVTGPDFTTPSLSNPRRERMAPKKGRSYVSASPGTAGDAPIE